MPCNIIYREMFRGRNGKTEIRPIMLKRNENEDKIETIYLIRDAYDAYNYEPNIPSSALEFHVIYDKKTGKSSGVLYYDAYNMDCTRQTGGKVRDPYGEDYIQAHEGYKCTGFSRSKVQFFPPKINSINALGKYIENRTQSDLDYSQLIGTIEIEGLKQTLRKHFGLNQNTEILTCVIKTIESELLDELSNNEYYFGIVSFNKKYFIFREFEGKKLQLLECKPAEEIRTREDFEEFGGKCLDAMPSDYDFTNEINLRENAAAIINDPELFEQEKKEKPRQQKLGTRTNKWKKLQNKKSSEEKKPIIELNMNYKDTLDEDNNVEPADPVMDKLIYKTLETLVFQEYKHFTREGVGFEYKCLDGLKVQHNIQDKQRIDLTERRLQFFREQQKKQQLNQQLNHIQNAGNNMEFQNERLHD